MKPKPKPVAYSYMRFSRPEQARGDSLRRQAELRDDWCRRNGVQLDESLDLADKGVSGFTGAHRKNPDRHALAAFLKAVEAGRVPRGSHLIVENLDRLSREHIRPALTLLLNLIEAGIRVVQLMPVEAVYDEDVEPMQLMMAIMELSRGHSESRVKSERIGRAWREKKRRAAEGVPVTPSVPSWLELKNGKIVAVPVRVAVVRRLFKLAADGWSIVQVCRTLNAERVPTLGPSANWNPSTVHKILRCRAVLGEYQPKGGRDRKPDGEPVPNYFPAIITEPEWSAADGALRGRCRGGGRTPVRHWNPFAGLLVDA
ncbi:MAG TPA: recombinase family protein, partial [Fimbriiglobus sp.]|nr:recombinase family protein [Fimbriiglobus sp.]